MYNAVIFDFDGTLCDTGEGVKKSVKYALDAFGLPCESLDELDCFIGPPLLISFQEKYNQSPSDADLLVKKFRERYSEIGLYESELYPDIASLLKNLKNDGVKVGIASSKPQKFVEALLEKFDIIEYFDAICAVSFNADCEPKQSIIDRCIKEFGCEISETVMVGDTVFDIKGANANSIDSIAVTWGYGSKFDFSVNGATYIADKVLDIEAMVLGLYERTESVKGIFAGKVINVHHDDVMLSNGNMTKRECVDHPGGVAIIGLTDDEKVLLVRQFRYPYKETIYEIPAGKLEKGEDPFDAGKREFKEETGAIADEYIWLGEVYPTPGYTNEIIRLYAAKGLHFEEQKLDDDEFLQVCKMPFDELIERVMSGEIKDAKTIIAALKLKELLKK